MTVDLDCKTVPITPGLYQYLVAHAHPPTPVQAELAQITQGLGQAAEMQIPHEQAVLLTLLARLTAARLVIEIGTFTGYSTLALALGSSPGTRIITCDISSEWTDIAQSAFRAAGVAGLIEVRLGPAADTLAALPEEPTADLAFIDADKRGYIAYWELLVPRMRPGGLILADNVLYGGHAAVPGADPDHSGNATAIDAFNAHVAADPRVQAVMLPIADGLTLAQKIAP